MLALSKLKPDAWTTDANAMQKLCIFLSMSLFSYAGWFLGNQVGETMTAFLTSGLFSLFGVWAGWKIHASYLA